jgi:hypothetical protein
MTPVAPDGRTEAMLLGGVSAERVWVGYKQSSATVLHGGQSGEVGWLRRPGSVRCAYRQCAAGGTTASSAATRFPESLDSRLRHRARNHFQRSPLLLPAVSRAWSRRRGLVRDALGREQSSDLFTTDSSGEASIPADRP